MERISINIDRGKTRRSPQYMCYVGKFNMLFITIQRYDYVLYPPPGFNGQAQVVVHVGKKDHPDIVFTEFDIQGDTQRYSTDEVTPNNQSIWPQGLWSSTCTYLCLG